MSTALNHVLVHAGMRVLDLAASIDHAVTVLGLEVRTRTEGMAELGLPGQLPCLTLTTAAEAAFDDMTLHTDEAGLVEVRDRAKRHDVKIHESRTGEPGAIRLYAPNGIAVEIGVGRRQDRNRTAREAGPTIGSFDHLSFSAEDMGAFVRFFEDVLGFRLSDSVNQERHWLRCGPNHHTVAVFTGPDGLHHYAFETDDIRGLAALGDVLAARGQNFIWGPGRHGLGANIFTYHLDPAGAVLEVTSDMLQIADDEEYEAQVWTDGLKSAVRWGPLPPADFRTHVTPSAAAEDVR